MPKIKTRYPDVGEPFMVEWHGYAVLYLDKYTVQFWIYQLTGEDNFIVRCRRGSANENQAGHASSMMSTGIRQIPMIIETTSYSYVLVENTNVDIIRSSFEKLGSQTQVWRNQVERLNTLEEDHELLLI